MTAADNTRDSAPAVRPEARPPARNNAYTRRRAALAAESKAQRQDERRQIVALVLAGMTYVEIASRLGKSPSTVRERFNDEMARNAKATDEARALHLARLDRQILRWWDVAMRSETHDLQGNELEPDERAERAQRADKASEHLRWLLDQYAKAAGLYHPTEVVLGGELKLEVSVPELNAKFEELKREIGIAEEARRVPTRALPAVSRDG